MRSETRRRRWIASVQGRASWAMFLLLPVLAAEVEDQLEEAEDTKEAEEVRSLQEEVDRSQFGLAREPWCRISIWQRGKQWRQ